MTPKKGDLLVVALVLLAAAFLFGLKQLPTANGTRVLRVELEGRLVDEITFNTETNDRFVIDLPAGQAVVEIAQGRVRVLPMSREICPLGICSSVGWVEHSGDAIICLPNRLVLTVFGGPADEVWDSLDGVTR